MNIDKICEQLTIDEKIRLLGGVGDWHTYDCNGKIPSIMMTDGPHGIRKLEQEKVGDIETSKPATCFPTASAIACSWNPAIVKKMGEAIAKEAKKEQISIVLGCGINIKRSPLCGRNFEYFSEDPYLTGKLATGYIEGVQSLGIGTSLKHYAVNSQETRRMTSNSQIDERTLREIYLSAFEEVVKKAKPTSVMASYNRINGEFGARNKYLLTDVLRKEWKYQGGVVSDWGAANDIVSCMKNGLTLEMPDPKGFHTDVLKEAYKDGRITGQELDNWTKNVLQNFVSLHENIEENYEVRNQFNCIISNPPWLAMSRLADNPYKAILYNKTERYGIKPPGSSHLHMELASTFLLSSIDKYLKEDARWMCIMPGSIMSGYHHEPFRRAHYISSVDAIETRIDEIWELPINTFKNKAIVLGGKRGSELTEYPVSGRIYSDRNTYQGCEYTLNIQGNRSAWTNRGSEEDVLNLINGEPWSFNQGADIMPRTILFHKFEQNPNNTWKMSRIEADSDLKYIINDSKMTTGSDIETDGVEDRFIFDCYISKHLSPFLVSRPAKIFMPAEKRYNLWECINDDDIALMNASTAYVFENIKSELAISLREYLEDKLNIRGKLYKQDFSLGRWLVLSNAGGANPCSAYIDLNEIDATKLIIDQTLQRCTKGT